MYGNKLKNKFISTNWLFLLLQCISDGNHCVSSTRADRDGGTFYKFKEIDLKLNRFDWRKLGIIRIYQYPLKICRII